MSFFLFIADRILPVFLIISIELVDYIEISFIFVGDNKDIKDKKWCLLGRIKF